MGETRLTFKRYEKKYLLTREQYEKLFRALEDHIVPDQYFRSTVCSLYYGCGCAATASRDRRTRCSSS